ncbi:MAG: DUF3261 domain-containing protein [Hyphomonadaceae bacterium]|nr:DUF3261 domain-containing protein [Hyphomonadaceae bacterium]
MPRRLACAACLSFALLGACTTIFQPERGPDHGYSVSIADSVELRLPERPGLTSRVDIVQTLIGTHAGETHAFQALVSGDADEFNVIILAIAGPRLVDISWSDAGVRQERSLLAPDQLDALNILADIFLVRWPAEAVQTALPEDATLVAGIDSRRIQRNGDTLISVSYNLEDEKGRRYTRLVNTSRQYSLSIYTD